MNQYQEKRSLSVLGITPSALEKRLADAIPPLLNPILDIEGSGCACTLTLTATAEDEQEAELMLTPMLRELREIFGDCIYAEGDATPEEVVSLLLRQRGMTLAVAESCTGGLLCERITNLPGASELLNGGVVVYTEFAKSKLLGIEPEFIVENSVVSAAVAAMMAKRVRKKLKSDFGIGITGWAGPEGENVGLVYVALAWKGDCVIHRMIEPELNRTQLRKAAADTALDMLRRRLAGLEL